MQNETMLTTAKGPRILIDPNPTQAAITGLEQALYSFELARLGPPDPARFAAFLQDVDGRTLGGAVGNVMWRRVLLSSLWLTADHRGQGLGAALLAAVESEAVRRNCRSIWLTALGSSAIEFYRAQNFSVVGSIENYVADHSFCTLYKELPVVDEVEAPIGATDL